MKLYNHYSRPMPAPVSLREWLRFAWKHPPIWWVDCGLEWGRYAEYGDPTKIKRGYHLQVIPNLQTPSVRKWFEWGWAFYDHPFRIVNFLWWQWSAYTQWTPWEDPDNNCDH